MGIGHEIAALLREEGCAIYGFADLRCLSEEVRQNFDTGIAIALSYTKEAMRDNLNGPSQKYYDEYNVINGRLPKIAAKAERLLVDRGYKALARPASSVVSPAEDYRSVLPHKTVATLAGVGWIGKCATLVTDEVGSALRLIVVLTNAPLACGTPVTVSKCPPRCTACADVCPGKAPLGGMWAAGVDRAAFFDAHACQPAARARAKAMLGIDLTLCGLCIANCPFTKKGLGYE